MWWLWYPTYPVPVPHPPHTCALMCAFSTDSFALSCAHNHSHPLFSLRFILFSFDCFLPPFRPQCRGQPWSVRLGHWTERIQLELRCVAEPSFLSLALCRSCPRAPDGSTLLWLSASGSPGCGLWSAGQPLETGGRASRVWGGGWDLSVWWGLAQCLVGAGTSVFGRG